VRGCGTLASAPSLAAATKIFEQIADRDRAAETASLLALLTVE
jgi:hypothetical protein